MLSTWKSSNVPMVIGLDGESVLSFYSFIFYIDIFLLSSIMTDLSLGDVDDHLDFEYKKKTEAYGSCGASLYGEMFVIGGNSKKRQVYINNKLKSEHLFDDDKIDIESR